MVTDRSYSDGGNMLLPLHGLLLTNNSKGILYVPYRGQDSTYHHLYYTGHGALDGTRNSSVGPP